MDRYSDNKGKSLASPRGHLNLHVLQRIFLMELMTSVALLCLKGPRLA
jgi:hypothetical protein